jgi:uncharacterized protein (DUF1778 family)
MTTTDEDHSAGFSPRQDMVGTPNTAPAGAGSGAHLGAGEPVRPCGVGGQAEPAGQVAGARGPGRRRARGEGHRTVRVDLRLNQQEAAALREAAGRTGLTRAGYCAAAALAAAGGTAPPRALPVEDERTRELLGALVATRFELVRVGTNLNQLARSANIDGTVLPGQLREVLARVDAGVRRLDVQTLATLGGDDQR